MILLNAVYFKGEWKIKFNSSKTVQKIFYHRKNGIGPLIEKYVPTMNVIGDFVQGYLEDLNAEFVQLPYKVNLIYDYYY